MPNVLIYRLFPDEIGNVLGDASLEDPLLHPNAKIHHEIVHSALLQKEDASDEVNNAGVLYYITGNDEEPFISLLSPPPTHIMLYSTSLLKSDAFAESLKHYLCTSVSYLKVGLSSKQGSDLYAWLIGFLSTQPPTSPLRALSLDFTDVSDLELLTQFMNVLATPSCRVLHLELCTSDEICFNYILKCLPEIRCLSISLWVMISNLDNFRHSTVDNIHLPPTLVVQLRIYCRDPCTDVIISRVCEMLKNETCKLKRLDLDVKPIGAQQMETLMQCVASSSCFVEDLGIDLGVNLVQAFTEHNSLSKLKVLRFHEVNTDEAAQCVVKILAIPHCKVRFLDIEFQIMSSNTFFSELRRVEARIECLRANYYLGSQKIECYNGLADFVGWEDCPLLWLHIINIVHPNDHSEDEDAKASELHLANALQVNYRLLFLRLGWRSDAARSRATAFLERNQLYKAAGLNSKQELAKPQVARLFLCGHGEVGKTTIRKALLNLNNRPSTSSSMLSQATTCINRALPCCTSEAQPEPRTRGLEIHQLCFHEGHEKLVIFDLAGQPDYHVFHHYFMNNTNNDLFMVVCKYVTGSTDDAELVCNIG